MSHCCFKMIFEFSNCLQDKTLKPGLPHIHSCFHSPSPIPHLHKLYTPATGKALQFTEHASGSLCSPGEVLFIHSTAFTDVII